METKFEDSLNDSLLSNEVNTEDCPNEMAIEDAKGKTKDSFPAQFPPELISHILSNLEIPELRVPRLICSDWDNIITDHVMGNHRSLTIGYAPLEYGYIIRSKELPHDYRIRTRPPFRRIVKRHSRAEEMTIYRSHHSREYSIHSNFRSFATNMAKLQELTKLSLVRFHLGPLSLGFIGQCQRLASVNFENCIINGKNLHALGDSLRCLRFCFCQSLRKEEVFNAIRSFSSRNIPLQLLRCHSNQDWTLSRTAPIITFCLANFPSLEELVFVNTDEPYDLEEMVATNIKVLTLNHCFRRDADVNIKFYRQLFLRPLPRLRELKIWDHIDARRLNQLLYSCSVETLEVLKFRTDVNINEFFDRLLAFKKLRELTNFGWTQYSLVHLVKIVEAFPNLTKGKLQNFSLPSMEEYFTHMNELEEVVANQPERPDVRFYIMKLGEQGQELKAWLEGIVLPVKVTIHPTHSVGFYIPDQDL